MMGDTHELGHGSEGTRQPSQPWAPTEPPQPDDDEAHHHARRKAQRLLTLSSRGGEGKAESTAGGSRLPLHYQNELR